MQQKLTFDEAINLIQFNGDIDLCDAMRCTSNGKVMPCVFPGDTIRELLHEWHETVQIAGPMARKKGYGVVLCDNYGYLFIYTISSEMKKLKIEDSPHQYPVN